jgi:riboflavin biosynthesis pyrimidine reductase
MDQDIVELYPQPGSRHALQGLYLGKIAEPAARAKGPFIYSNFISSLDGRIALPGPERTSHEVPPAIANRRDWRLFQELAAQADLLVTSARYFRQLASHEAQDELPVGSSPEFDDLRAWRVAHGLSAQPDIAVFTASLDIPVQALHQHRDRKLFLVSGALVDAEKLRQLMNSSHAQHLSCGEQTQVDASLLRAKLAELGYKRVYSIAGPAVLHTLIRGNALDRLYHTTAHCLLGGTQFDTIAWGAPVQPAFNMHLQAMYLDPHAPADAGQTLAVYDR